MATLQAGLKPLFNKTYNRYSKDLKDKYIITTDNSGNITGKVSVGSLLSKAKYSGGYVADGVIVTQNPQAGDILFLDDEGIRVFVKNANDELIKANLPESWTLVGYVFNRGKTDIITGETDDPNQVWVVEKNVGRARFCAIPQFSISQISSTSITLEFRMESPFTTRTPIPITLSSTSINNVTASEINTAIRAKASELSSEGDWWAYYDEENDRIIVQNDIFEDYRQMTSFAATGCVMSSTLTAGFNWASVGCTRKDGVVGGAFNSSAAISYYSTNGSQDTTVGLNTGIMSRTAFESSTNADVVAYRNSGKTYENYIIEYKMFMLPQPSRSGILSLMTSQEISKLVATVSAPKRTGGTIYMYPALKNAHDIDYGGELGTGEWFMAGVQQLLYLLNDTADADFSYTKVTNSSQKMGTSTFRVGENISMPQLNSAMYSWIALWNTSSLASNVVGFSNYFQAVTCLYL